MYRIYKIDNTINSLLYVGYTCGELEKRLWTHKGAARSLSTESSRKNPLYIAMHELGVDNFFIHLLEEGEDNYKGLKGAYGREREWIERLNTAYPNGYNRHVFKLTDTEAAIIRFDAYNLSKAEYAAMFDYSLIAIRSIQDSRSGTMYSHVTPSHLPKDIEAYALRRGHAEQIEGFRQKG